MSQRTTWQVLGLFGALGFTVTALATIFDVQSGLCANLGSFCPSGAAVTTPAERTTIVERPVYITPTTPQDALPPTGAEAERAWATAKAIDTRVGYETFVSQHPATAYAIEAREKIRLLSLAEEGDAWRQAMATNTRAGFEDFLGRYPASIQSVAAREAIKRLQTGEADAAWANAVTQDTVESYRRYLTDHPGSANDARAREAIRRLQSAAESAKAQETEQACRSHALSLVPQRSYAVSGGISACLGGFISGNQDDCQRNAQRAFEDGQRQQQRDTARRDAEFQSCLRNGGPRTR